MMARAALLPSMADRTLPPSILLIVARAARSMNMVSIAIILMSLTVIRYVALLILSTAPLGGLFRRLLTSLFLFCSVHCCGGADGTRTGQLQRISRIRREIGLQAAQMQALIDADLDGSAAVQSFRDADAGASRALR